MAVRKMLLISSALALLSTSIANPLAIRQAASSTSSATSTSLLTATSSVPLSTTLSTTNPPSAATGTATTSAATGTLSSTTTQSAVSTASLLPGVDLHTCNTDQVQPGYSPFCEPGNGTDKLVDNSFYITWDKTQLLDNSTVQILADYSFVNTSSSAGVNAWSSPAVDGVLGFVIITMDNAWLQGMSANSLNLTLVDNGIDSNGRQAAKTFRGPVISIVTPGHYPPPPTTTINPLGLQIGIPLGVAAFILILFGLFFGMRRQRQVDVGAIKSLLNRKKGYGVRKSRAQRMGQKKGLVANDGQDEDAFRDDPVELQQRGIGGDGYRDHQLSHSPPREHFMEGSGGANAFRDEVARQQTGRPL